MTNMCNPGQSAGEPASMCGLAGCLAALIVTLLLPALRTYHFSPSYRPIEVCQSAARHCSLDVADHRGDTALPRAVIPSFTGLLRPCLRIVSELRAVLVSRPRLACLLVRLRLGADRAADPPLFA
jgi:hypothetical protein